jgi:hypothetical protein
MNESENAPISLAEDCASYSTQVAEAREGGDDIHQDDVVNQNLRFVVQAELASCACTFCPAQDLAALQ